MRPVQFNPTDRLAVPWRGSAAVAKTLVLTPAWREAVACRRIILVSILQLQLLLIQLRCLCERFHS